MLFFATSFFALLHFLKPLILRIFKKINIEYSQKKVVISCALIPLLFFFFNTQMHERYSHPALIFLAVYAILYNRPLVFILGSIAYFLNMQDVFQALETDKPDTWVFIPLIIAIIYLMVILLLFADLYKVKLVKKKDI
jgi:hypothetical protein